MTEYASWCQTLFAKLNQGGVWGMPRSGLVFRKTGKVLLLVGTIPPELPLPSEILADAREGDFDATAEAFASGGIPVWRANVLRHFDSMDAVKEHYGHDGETARVVE